MTAPTASELPEAVADAIDAITDAYNETDDGYGCAAALEAWARSQQAADASSMWDKGFAAGIALQEKCDAQSKAVPGPVVPQLEGLHAKRCSEGHHPIYMHQDLYCPACVANRRLEERIADGQLLRAQLAEAEGRVANSKLSEIALSLAHEFEVAVASREPKSGMQVPPSGDFISCAQLPSAVGRMKWWAREIRKAQESAPLPETEP